MELNQYLKIISRRKWTILITTIVTLAVTIAGTWLMTPLYQATATLRVSTVTQGSLDYVVRDVLYTDRLMNTYAKIVASSPMLNALVTQLALSKPPSVKVDISANTELMQISVEDPNPALAARAANTLTEFLLEFRAHRHLGLTRIATCR